MRFLSLLLVPLFLSCADTDKNVTELDDDSDGFAGLEDCDDNNPAVYPNAPEVCDGVDNDCDDLVDDEDDNFDTSTGSVSYADSDGDGYGDGDAMVHACEIPSGFVEDDTDCDDSNGDVHPGATEVCDDDDVDEDCDGLADNDDSSTDPSSLLDFYMDYDQDGYGDANMGTSACEAPTQYGTDSTDCNDTDSAINPAAAEVCDGVDNNCDLQLDDSQTVSQISGTTYTDMSASFQGTSTSPASVTLAGGDLLFCDGTYYVHMVTTDDLVISASGAVVLDGGGTGTILHSDTDNLVVEASGVSLQNGFATNSIYVGVVGGGAINLSGDDTQLTIDSVTFSSNTAGGSSTLGGVGGALNTQSGLLEITSSTFTGNSASFGGAISATGDVVIDQSTFTNNYGRTDFLSGGFEYGGQGGAINYQAESDGSIFQVSDTDFNGNTADSWGGAFATYALDSNLDPYTTTLNVTDATFTNNTAAYCGAVGSTGGDAVFQDALFQNNIATGTGGALCLFSSESQLIDSTIEANSAEYAGAIYLASDSTLECEESSGTSAIIDNSTTVTASGYRGAIYISDSEFISDGCSYGESVSTSNNAPADISAEDVGGSGAEFSYGDNATFTCDETGCPEASCTDNQDDNGDGYTDCDDYSCASDSSCAPVEDCSNGTDDDSDGYIDCADLDCDGQLSSGSNGTGYCEFGTEASCQDGFDNDGGGLADCADSDCASDSACIFEDCSNGIDDDSDGYVDCLDFDCDGELSSGSNGTGYCEFGTEATCQDGFDNEGDGYPDCRDEACYTALIGQSTTFASATEDWVTPPSSCTTGTISANDLLFVQNSSVDGCMRYYTDTQVDTVLTHMDTCTSLGGTVEDCNDDIDINSWNLASELYVDVESGGGLYLYVSKWDYEGTSAAVSVEEETPEICYTVNMYDDYGDGWNGGYLTFTQNGTAYVAEAIDHGLSSTLTTDTALLCLDSTSFDITWTAGTFDDEVTFDLTAPNGDSVCWTYYPGSGQQCGGPVVPECDQL